MACERVIHPGPKDKSLLCLQDVHVSECIWNGENDRVLHVRRAGDRQMRGELIPPQIIPLLRQSRFYGVSQLDFFQVEHTLISALIERWRPETHTFHMPSGECTISLQDVSIQMGLKVDGEAVTDVTFGNWQPLVHELLGVAPPEEELNGGRLRMKWLDQHFGDFALHAHNEIQVQRFTRAYILRIMGGLLFPDHSGRYVSLRYLPLLADLEVAGTYSWGSAVLSYLYRELCKATDYARKEIGGACVLVQLWAWSRFPCIAPQAPDMEQDDLSLGARWSGGQTYIVHHKSVADYRLIFDKMELTDMVWVPYTQEIMGQLPPYCLEGHQIWTAMVPLICFHIVEWHQPDRCMRQFGMQQHIPRPPSQPDKLHDVTLKGKGEQNWRLKHAIYIQQWDDRWNYIWTNAPMEGDISSNSEYMVWYKNHTRRWITQAAAKTGNMEDSLERMYFTVTSEGESCFSFENMRSEIRHCMQICKQIDRISVPAVSAPSPFQPAPEAQVSDDIPVGRIEGQGLHRRRRRVGHEQLTIPPPPVPQPGMYYVPPVQPFDPVSTYYYASHATTRNIPTPNTMDPPPFPTGDCYVPSPPVECTPPMYNFTADTPTAPGGWIHPWQHAPLMSTASGGLTYGASSSRQPEPPSLGFNLNEAFAEEESLFHDVTGGGYQEPRKNPPRDARNRRRHCVLSSWSPNN